MRTGAIAVRGALWIVVGLLVTGVARAAEPTAPVQVVESLHAGMIDVMQTAGSAPFETRLARLGPLIEESFDLDFMARKSLGRSFDTLSADDQKAWIEAFHRFMLANYAGRISTFSGQRFDTLGDDPAAQDTVLVRTRLTDPGAENIDLGYRLRQADGRWQIIDVYLKGTVSELALRRSDFTAILDREGFPALLASIDAKTADLKAGKVK